MEGIRERTHRGGVACERPVFKPLHSDLGTVQCPNSNKAHDCALSIPLYPGLSRQETDYVVARLEEILKDLIKTKLDEQ